MGKKSKLVKRLKSTAAVVVDTKKKIERSLSDTSLKEPGHLLKMGIKFSSQDAFQRCIGLPGKVKKKKSAGAEVEKATTLENHENDVSLEKNNEVFEPVAPPRKKRKENGLSINKLREMLDTEDRADEKKKKTKTIASMADEARAKLAASRFRYLNEQLYSQPSNAAVKLFNSDSTLFTAYHQGYQHQAQRWPLDPLNVMITDLLRQDSTSVVADLGCGERGWLGASPTLFIVLIWLLLMTLSPWQTLLTLLSRTAAWTLWSSVSA